MTTNVKNIHTKKNGTKDTRPSLMLHLSAGQGELLKEILSRELSDTGPGRTGARTDGIMEVLTSVQTALDQAERYMEMRGLSGKADSEEA